MTTTTDLLQRATDLHRWITEGRVLEALDEFYDENVSMQEGMQEPMVGREANRAREAAWMENIAEWKGFEVLNIAVEGDTSLAETTMDFVTKDGTEVHLEQVARAQWRNGRIVSERFYSA